MPKIRFNTNGYDERVRDGSKGWWAFDVVRGSYEDILLLELPVYGTWEEAKRFLKMFCEACDFGDGLTAILIKFAEEV